MSEILAAGLNESLPTLDAAARLRALRAAVPGRIVFTSSLGLEDQVLTHLIWTGNLDIEIATLDTGRLFAQTHALWAATETRYQRRIAAFYPGHAALEDLVRDQGIDGFYASVAARKACCGIRKVQPLRRALAGASAWITGLRADQSVNRGDSSFAAFDASHGLIKVNPLLDWSRDQALAYAQTHDIPLNPLHGEGFLSIGCAPCTRAVKPGEPERAGRWWWEDEDKKECGLHVSPDGRLVRGPVEAQA